MAKTKTKTLKHFFPKGIERSYGALIIRALEAINKASKPAVQRFLLLQRLRLDTLEEDNRELQKAGEVAAAAELAKAAGEVAKVAQRVNLQNYSVYEKAFNLVSAASQIGGQGIPTISLPQRLNGQRAAETMAAWAAKNSELIKAITDEQAKRTAALALEAVNMGTSERELSKQLANMLAVETRRARTIARTETAKLYGELTRQRDLELGLDKYIFSTSDDIRVRHSHKLMEGKTCDWNDPTVMFEGGEWVSRGNGVMAHPGQEVNCRCVALAVIDL